MCPLQFQKYSMGKFRWSWPCRTQTYVTISLRCKTNNAEGDHIKVTASKYPFPTVCADKASPDWFNAISRTLRWNEREKQKSFVVVEEDHEQETVKKHSDRKKAEKNMTSPPAPETSAPERQQADEAQGEGEGEESDDEDEEEEEDYDIDE